MHGVLLRAGDAAGALETLTQVPREEESEGRRMLIEALAEALAELVEHHRAIRELRRSVTASFAYPVLVLCFAV